MPIPIRFPQSALQVIAAIIASLAMLLTAMPASAQGYTPDVLEVSKTGPLAFEPQDKLELSEGGAIEFWVAAEWSADPGYDPPVIINIGPQGILYQVSILRDRDGLVFANADDEDVFIADFSDGALHHVALNIMEDGVEVYVDGALVGSTELLPLNLPSAGLFVGGLGTEESVSLEGAIAQLRFWSEPLEQDEIVDFRLRDVLDAAGGDHPAAEFLVAQSDFTTEELLVVDTVEVLP